MLLRRIDAATGQIDEYRRQPQAQPSRRFNAIGPTGAIAWIDRRGVYVVDGAFGSGARTVDRVRVTTDEEITAARAFTCPRQRSRPPRRAVAR